MHSAKDKHFRSFPIGTEVLSFADSKAESSSSQLLRRQMSDITIYDDEYPAPEKVSISYSSAKLPFSLKIFMRHQ
jgi:hypothetical protein